MSIHKLNTESSTSNVVPLPVGVSLRHDLDDFADAVLKSRVMLALNQGATLYPIYRLARCATRRKRVHVFDDLALHSGLVAVRFYEHTLLLDGPGVYVEAKGWRKADYCSCEFHIWAESIARANAIREKLVSLVGEVIDCNRIFTIDWFFVNARSNLTSAAFDEMTDEVVHDQAYPSLQKSVGEFIEQYLNAKETVLLLQGPPGTGKTRLVRSILARMSERKEEPAKIMYTADRRALENDQIFVEFITGSHDAFVIEDADHLLKARSSGNQELHRFLAIADGVVRAQGRKIIFTTNLPNITDIDDALLRPGRCFASVHVRSMTRDEAAHLISKLVDDEVRRATILSVLFTSGTRAVPIARIYQELNRQ